MWQGWHFRHSRGAAQRWLPHSPAIRVTSRNVVAEVGAGLRSVAGVALSALLRGCADRAAELLAIRSPPIRDVAGVALSALLWGCADRVAELPAMRSAAQRRGIAGTRWLYS